jgi:hypothetical protein
VAAIFAYSSRPNAIRSIVRIAFGATFGTTDIDDNGGSARRCYAPARFGTAGYELVSVVEGSIDGLDMWGRFPICPVSGQLEKPVPRLADTFRNRNELTAVCPMKGVIS